MSRKCIKVETEETHEIFTNISKAIEYIKYLKEPYKLNLVVANNTYYEDNGELNYDDNSNHIEEEY